MKKLMFAAVAGLCASVFAEGEIASVNIVGYQQKTLNWDEEGNTFSYLVNTLPSVGKAQADITLDDFKITSTEGLASEGSALLTTLGPDGQTIEDYCYIDQYLIDNYAAGFVETPGWYVSSSIYDEPIAAGTSKIPFNAGVQFQTDGCGAAITFAGEVLNSALPITCNYDEEGNTFTYTGNTSPVRRQLKEFAVTCGEAEGLASEGSALVTTLGADGQTVEDYCYIDQYLIDNYAAGFVETPGWYVSSSIYDEPQSAADVWIEAGECFQIQTDMADVAIVVPSAL